MKQRRTLEDVERFYDPQEIVELIENAKPWPYGYPIEGVRERDRCLLALAYLTGGRVSELLNLTKSQLNLEDPDFVILKDMKLSKRRKNPKTKQWVERAPVRPEIPLPRKGPLSALTKMVLEYLSYLEAESKLFPFSRQWAHRLVRYSTGKWLHWFRSQSESYYAKVFGDSLTLAKFFGVKNVASVEPYVFVEWRDFRGKLSGLILKHENEMA